MKRLVAIGYVIACLYPLAGLAQYTEREAQAIARLETKLKSDVANDSLYGSISAVIVKGDKVLWAKAFGYANRDTKKLADTTTIYRIGSITKTFTATLLMMLIEDKMISLDDPAEKYVPEVKNIIAYGKDSKFTIRQLASHTSGLQREPARAGVTVGGENEWQALLLAALPSASLASKPGRQWLYSNLGFGILGLALERAAGVPYVKMVKDRIVNPLHMTHTTFSISDPNSLNLAQGLDNTSGIVNTDIPLRQHTGRGYVAANGSLYSTPTDLAKLISLFVAKQNILSKASIHRMQSIPKGGNNYGLGIYINPRSDLDLIGHDGMVPGYTAQFSIEKYSKYAVILMRNYNVGLTSLGDTAGKLLEDIFQ